MHCVEIIEEIGTKCNLTLFIYQKLLYDLYSKPSMKLADQFYSVSVLALWRVTQMVVEAICLCSCLWVNFPGGHL